MVRRVGRRLGVAITALLVALLLPVAGGAAFAAPTPTPPPPSVVITGDGLATPLSVRADAAAFGTVMEQVSWLGGAGQTNAPAAADLGPKYTVLVLAGDMPKQTYDLYPLAKGGPRACRPAKQPDQRRNTAAPAWFYGRLSMSESLLAAGVPLARQDAQIGAGGGGVGGGERVVPDERLNPSKDLNDMFSDLRQLLLLNAAVIIFITLGLAGISLLVRRRTR